MRLVLRFPPRDALPDAGGVRERAGLPDAEPPERIARLLASARSLFERLAEPRAVVEELNRDEFAAVHRGLGRNATETVLDRVAPRASALALFAATLGEPVCARIRELFEQGDPALGFVLDATASEGADRLAELAAVRLLTLLRERSSAEDHTRVLAYSPGYCGWHVSGQHALFERLAPGEIGIHLSSTSLMSPLKSVSGVLVAGAAETHLFRPDFPFCESCVTHACRARMRQPGHAA